MIDIDILNKLYPNKYRAKKIATIVQEEPVVALPIVTQQDAQNGFLDRYFVKAANQSELIVEVDKAQYDIFKQNPRFVVVKLKWKIKGKIETTTTPYGVKLIGVRDYNTALVAKEDLTFNGLARYINNYTGYWVSEE